MGLFNTGGFIGEFRHSLDDKGRLTMPSAWRPKAGDSENYFLALPSVEEGSEAYVRVLSPKRIAQLEEKIDQIPASDVEGQRMVVELMSMAHQFSCDKQGRINLNEKLINHADLEKSVVLLGEASKFMIYDEAFYGQLMTDDEDTEDLADIAKGFGF